MRHGCTKDTIKTKKPAPKKKKKKETQNLGEVYYEFHNSINGINLTNQPGTLL